MKWHLCITMLLLCTPTISEAGVIYDARTGVYEPGDPLPDIVGAVVTWVCADYGGMYITEVPSGENRGIRVHATDISQYSPGQVVTVSASTYGGDSCRTPFIGNGVILVTGAAEIPWVDITTEEFFGAPYDALNCAPIHITDDFTVTSVFNGGWQGTSKLTGITIFTSFVCGGGVVPELEGCYQGVRGIFDRCDGFMMILPDGVEFLDCTVPNRKVNVGAIKSMY